MSASRAELRLNPSRLARRASAPALTTQNLSSMAKVESLHNFLMFDGAQDDSDIESFGMPSRQVSRDAAPSKARKRRNSIFKDHVARALEPRESESFGSSWLTTMRNLALQFTALLLYICIDAHDGLVKAWSKSSQPTFPYRLGSVMLIVKLETVLIAGCIAVSIRGSIALRQIFDLQSLASCALPAALISVSQLLHFAALGYLSAESVAVADKSQLVLLAMLSFSVLGRRYSFRQWVAIFLVAAFTGVFVYVQDTGSNAGSVSVPMSSDCRRGWILLITGMLVSCLASVACEKLLQKDDGELFVVQKARLCLPGTLVALMAMFSDGASYHPRDFFVGWDRRTLLVMVLMLAKAWIVTFLVKIISSLALGLASTAAMLVTFMEARFLLGGRGVHCSEAAALLMIAASMGCYVEASSAAKKAAKRCELAAGSPQLAQPLLSRRGYR